MERGTAIMAAREREDEKRLLSRVVRALLLGSPMLRHLLLAIVGVALVACDDEGSSSGGGSCPRSAELERIANAPATPADFPIEARTGEGYGESYWVNKLSARLSPTDR